ncbi:MAG TPA: pyridoxal-dependent decarboxylase [Haliangiales bacterium]|nr:pyridoxal-dependent decarboxylase [Haliangiales bacterium]
MDAEEFRRLGHLLVDWVAEYRTGLAARPVMSPVRPGAIKARFPVEPPRRGTGLSGIVDALERDVLPGITHWNHPSFFAYFPSNTTYASILADIVASGLGVQGMSWQTSPAATEVEEVVMDWLRRMVGLSGAWTGVIHDTASTATLCALLCAREKASGFAQEAGGLQADGPPLIVYASREGHSSIEKAALLAGFGRAHLRLIDTDEDHALRLPLLADAVAADVAAGRRPAAVVAAVGTTGTTAIDPVAGIAALAEKHGMWLHVDAAMAGTAMIVPECRWMWEGVERADSVVFNPHKWMGVGFDLSAYYVRDPDLLVRVMSTNPTYLRTDQDGAVKNFRDWHIQLGRRFRALKLWFLLLDVGVEGLQARVRRDLAHAAWLKAEVDAAPDWERLAPVPLQTVCMRHAPARLRGDEAALAEHNRAIARRINDGGKAYLISAMLKGKQAIRVSIGAEGTERRHVEALWRSLQAAGAEV